MSATQLKNVKQTGSPQPPVGTWRGTWSGWQVSFDTPSGMFEGETEQGIRGTTECLVTVSHDGQCIASVK